MQIHSIIICYSRTPIHWHLTYSTTEKRLHSLYLSRNAKKCAEYLNNLNKFNSFQETIERVNGFEETIGNF